MSETHKQQSEARGAVPVFAPFPWENRVVKGVTITRVGGHVFMSNVLSFYQWRAAQQAEAFQVRTVATFFEN